MQNLVTCLNCRRKVLETDAVFLWDSEWHCVGCVDVVNPALVEYSKIHKQLTATFRREQVSLLRYLCWKHIPLLFALEAIFLGICVFRLPQFTELACVFAFVVVVFLVMLELLLGVPNFSHNYPLVVSIAYGQVRIQLPVRSVVRPVEECRLLRMQNWRITEGAVFSKCDIAVLQFNNREGVVCAIEPDEVEVWDAFFKLSKVEL